MMARGYGDIGVFKGALFVPGLTKDLISTVEFDLDGREESTRAGVKEIWGGKIDESEMLLRFERRPNDLFYHWVEPYQELSDTVRLKSKFSELLPNPPPRSKPRRPWTPPAQTRRCFSERRSESWPARDWAGRWTRTTLTPSC
jgi:hypothetical protein